jgi:hypothetical protein
VDNVSKNRTENLFLEVLFLKVLFLAVLFLVASIFSRSSHHPCSAKW